MTLSGGVPPRPAATVMVLRPSEDGLQVFLLKRTGRAGFMPDAWVFPGGRVEESDRLAGNAGVRGGEAVLTALGMSREDGVATLVAAVRETFEESGIWLGTGEVPVDLRHEVADGKASLGDLLAQHGATIDLDRLAAWSWWVTPTIEPKRFDTRFLVAKAFRGEGTHDQRETVESGWFRPADVLAASDSGRMRLAPPTWWTLRELAAYDHVDGVMTAASARPCKAIQPILEVSASGWSLQLPGHPAHPEAAIPGLPTAIRMVDGKWVAS